MARAVGLFRRSGNAGHPPIGDAVRAAKASRDMPLPSETRAEIVGGINDGEGLQAMVVAIGGSTDRPDGGTFHITWSLDRARGRRPVQSNAVIAAHGWRSLDDPVPIRIIPARL